MPSIPKIVVACGTAIATSTHVAIKIQEHMQERGLKVNTVQARVSEVPSMIEGACAVVATAEVPFELGVPIISGLPFLTGVGKEEVLEQIEQIVRENQGGREP